MAPSDELQFVDVEDDYSESEGSEDSCDSLHDPTYDIAEETQSRFSNLSIGKKSKSRSVCVYVNRIRLLGFIQNLSLFVFMLIGFVILIYLCLCWIFLGFFFGAICSEIEMDQEFDVDLEDDVEMVASVLDKKDEKCFEIVQKMIEGL